MNQNQLLNAPPPSYGAAGYGAEPRTTGAYTGRICGMTNDAERFRDRLSMLLAHMRSAPPSAGQPAGLVAARLTIEDYLQATESAHKSIGDALNELEGLFS